MARRNLNFKVAISQDTSYLVKWPSGDDSWSSLAREAATYTELDALTPGFRSSMWPRLHDYDAEKHIVVLEFLTTAASLSQYYLARRRWPVSLARWLGQVLATIHSFHPVPFDKGFPSRPHWVLDIHRPQLCSLPALSSAVLDAISLIQSSNELTSHIEKLRMEWSTEGFIHGDVRWDNCLTYPFRGSGPPFNRVVLVDWEFAGPGDPFWDVGCAIGGYLSYWAMLTPIGPNIAPERALELVQHPLNRMQPAMRALWAEYARRAHLAAEANACLLRTVRFAGASLIKTAIESLDAAPRLTTSALALIQLGANILARPHEATSDLIGIPWTR